MNNTLSTIIAATAGALLITLIAWTKGNDNFYTHEIKEFTSPLEVKNPDPDREYFRETVVVETVSPSSTPFLFESKYDTLSTKFMSSKRR